MANFQHRLISGVFQWCFLESFFFFFVVFVFVLFCVVVVLFSFFNTFFCSEFLQCEYRMDFGMF